jgi:hypothetical protein
MEPDSAGYIGAFVMGALSMLWLLARGKGPSRRGSGGRPYQPAKRKHKTIN